jgi:hypothetical protein
MPSFEMKLTKTNTRNTQSNMSAKNLDKVGSNSLLIMMFLTMRLMNRMT